MERRQHYDHIAEATPIDVVSRVLVRNHKVGWRNKIQDQ